jgi:hypothetical protein
MVYASDKILKITANNQQHILLQGGATEVMVYKKKYGLSRLDAFVISQFADDFV